MRPGCASAPERVRRDVYRRLIAKPLEYLFQAAYRQPPITTLRQKQRIAVLVVPPRVQIAGLLRSRLRAEERYPTLAALA